MVLEQEWGDKLKERCYRSGCVVTNCELSRCPKGHLLLELYSKEFNFVQWFLHLRPGCAWGRSGTPEGVMPARQPDLCRV